MADPSFDRRQRVFYILFTFSIQAGNKLFQGR